jgi:hypothetical protein
MNPEVSIIGGVFIGQNDAKRIDMAAIKEAATEAKEKRVLPVLRQNRKFRAVNNLANQKHLPDQSED